jgi:hypothetical protein
MSHIGRHGGPDAENRCLLSRARDKRHTFGAEYRAASGSDTEIAAVLGHSGLK